MTYWKENISEEAERDVEQGRGVLEFTLPYVWMDEIRNEDTPSHPHFITVGIVPDDDTMDVLERIGYWNLERPPAVDEEAEKVVSSRLESLLGDGRVCYCHDDEIDGPGELGDCIGDMCLILK